MFLFSFVFDIVAIINKITGQDSFIYKQQEESSPERILYPETQSSIAKPI